MKVVFMGSPEFAAVTLSALAKTNHEMIAVYTKPPTYSGRGLKENKSAVHMLADELKLNVLTPQKLREVESLETFRSLAPDVAIVAAYGLIIPEAFLQIPKYGFINIHPSDLPRWRGAAPIQRTIMAGDIKTAVCIMQMDKGLDTGDVILRKEFELDEKITAKELHDRSAKIGSEMVIEALTLINQGEASFTKQSEIGVTYAEKISRDEERINFNESATDVNCKIRGLSPRPGAYFVYNNEIIKIIAAEVIDATHDLEPGVVVDEHLNIACGEGIIRPILLQRQGKKMMYTDAFLRGFSIPANTRLSQHSLIKTTA